MEKQFLLLTGQIWNLLAALNAKVMLGNSTKNRPASIDQKDLPPIEIFTWFFFMKCGLLLLILKGICKSFLLNSLCQGLRALPRVSEGFLAF